MVVFVHGDERQAHSAFIQRLQEVILPELLRLDPKTHKIDRLLVRWSEPLANLQQRKDRLQLRLTEALKHLRSGASTDYRPWSSRELAVQLARHQCPVMVWSSVLSSDWQFNDPRLIEEWLSAWSAWPDLPHGQLLMIVLSILYRDVSQFGLLRRWKVRKRNEAIESFLTKLGFSKLSGISGVTLERLEGVSETDVLLWIDDQLAEFARETRAVDSAPRVIAEKLTPSVREFFASSKELSESGGVPMETLAIALRRQLAECLVPWIFDYYTKLGFSPAHNIHKIHALRSVSASSALSSLF